MFISLYGLSFPAVCRFSKDKVSAEKTSKEKRHWATLESNEARRQRLTSVLIIIYIRMVE